MQQGAEQFVLRGLLGFAEHHLVAEVAGAGADHVYGLREGGFIDEEDVALGLGDPSRHGHGFGGGGGLVEQGGIGDLHAGEVDHHLLVIEQGFQAALRDLGLVGRVGRVPAGVLEQVAQDHRRCVRAVVALADQRFLDYVLPCDGFQRSQRRVFGHRRRQVERTLQADRRGNRLSD